MKFTSLTISPGTAAMKWLSDYELSFGSAREPTKKKESTMRVDRALHMATNYFSQNMVPLRSGCTVQHACLLR